MTMYLADTRHDHQEDLLTRLLAASFGELDDATTRHLRERLQWVEIAGGEVLMRQGDAGDAMFISVSGRLRAYVADDGAPPRMVREMSRGQVIGELAMFTGEPRSATVVAIRESVLVRLDKADFDDLLATHPSAAAALTRRLIERLLHPQRRSLQERPVTMGVLPASGGVDLAAFCRRLAAPLQRFGRVRVVDGTAVAAALAPHGLTLADEGPALNRALALFLDEVEAGCEFVLLLADAEPGPWTQRCTRHSDELLLVADADAEPVLHPVEQACLLGRPPHAEAAEILVLLHADAGRAPSTTAAWLARRPVEHHLHVRLGHERDFERLARLQARAGVGLVFAGGGARGVAHLGIADVLRERGIPVDCVGGTSMGSLMATLVACDAPPPQVQDIARRLCLTNVTGDVNPLPLISVMRGQRMARGVGASLRELFGRDGAAVEDLWLPFFCVATNYSKAREERIERGPLLQALLASAAIPGALPPVVRDGDLLCDGGTFNNFPVDAMQAQRGIGFVIGVDLGSAKPRRIEFDPMPTWWQLALDRLRPRRQRRFRLPSLPSYLMNTTVLYSNSRRAQALAAVDLCFNPPLPGIGLLDWLKFDAVLEQGRVHARAVLDALDPALRARLSQGDAP